MHKCKTQRECTNPNWCHRADECWQNADAVQRMAATERAAQQEQLAKSAGATLPSTVEDKPGKAEVRPAVAALPQEDGQRLLSLALDMLKSCVGSPFTESERDQCQRYILDAMKSLK